MWRCVSLSLGVISARALTFDLSQVCTEETLNQIQDRYIAQCNSHAKAYVWKRFGNLLDMSQTLTDNGVEDDSDKMDLVGIDEDEWLPVLHLYFSDDLTFA